MVQLLLLLATGNIENLKLLAACNYDAVLMQFHPDIRSQNLFRYSEIHHYFKALIKRGKHLVCDRQ